MNPMMKKLLEKKLEQGKNLSDDESSAQMSVLKDLKGQMGGMMGDKLTHVKKGLNNGKDYHNNGQQDSSSPSVLHEPEEEMELHENESETPDEHKTPDELEEKIQSLMALKKSKEEPQE